MKLKRDQIVGANYHYTRYTFDYFVRSVKSLGLDAIELYAADPHLYVGEDDPDRLRRVKQALKSSGIKVKCFTPENCVYPINIALEDEDVRSRSLAYYRRAIEYAAELEAPLVQTVGGRGYYDGDLSGAWSRSADSLGKMAAIAKGYGITLVLEASSYATSTVIHSCRNIRDMLDELRLDNVKAMIDTNAVEMAGEDFEDCVRLLGSDLIHMHFIDARPGAYCLVPGEGEMPLGHYLEILAQYGYKGVLTPELWGNTYVQDPETALKNSVAYCLRRI